MKTKILIATILLPMIIFSQRTWKSARYGYIIEIPQGFSQKATVGANVDFKATKGVSSIVIVVKNLPREYFSYSLWDLLGDLSTYGYDWEIGAKEYLNNPKFLKYGKTTLSDMGAFWFDYTTDNPVLYSKNYQIKKGGKLYTITLTCPKSKYNYYMPFWYRFKDKFRLNSNI